ncbi:hypothetical protein AK95_23820 [Paenibacillus sp. LC231]|uniref:hypothetical protein n=1 Tax=Paenibacillus sp. LC231 TaxID=1120679 RepID=UPI0008DE509D|nr:hypothetical protein [Paenibacillus sp. LC231]OIB00190.1 hypothetical protein AK95_23820 [Paenibacillus sp. LC231]
MKVIEPLGRRFFWVKSTGNIVAQRGEMSAGIESTKEEDFAVYVELSQYDPDAIEMTTFEPGQYAEDFKRAKEWRFNPHTGLIEFFYNDPNKPESEDSPMYQRPLTEEIINLKAADLVNKEAIALLFEMQLKGGN